MKLKRKILSILLCLILILHSFNLIKLNSKAAGGYFTEDSFSLTSNAITIGDNAYDAYTMTNDSNLPDSFYYYMKIQDGTCITCNRNQIITNILNYKVGVTFNGSSLADFIYDYINAFPYNNASLSGYNWYIFHPVLKNGQIVGLALNDLTGCRVAYSTGNDSVTVPSEEVNNVYNYFNYWTINISPDTPDIINMPYMAGSSAYGLPTKSNIMVNSDLTDDKIYCMYRKHNTNARLSYNGFGASGTGLLYFDKNSILVAQSENQFNSICNLYQLSLNDDTLELNDYLGVSESNNNKEFYIYDGTNLTLKTQINGYNPEASQGISASGYGNLLTVYGSEYGKLIPLSLNDGYITVYKSLNVPQSIQNNTYSRNYYTSNNTKNFNVENNNSYTTSVQNINNSTTNNTNIYNESKTEINKSTEENNYNYNNTENNTTVNNIINNYYYGDDNGGVSDDDDDDNDDSIWKALLTAIANFFTKIGELLAAVLTGIIGIFTQMIEAAATITTGFTGLTDLFSNFFDWLPTEILAPLILGLTAMIFICLLKAFKG